MDINRPPGWYTASQWVGLSPGSVAAGRDREIHGATHNWPSVVRVREGLSGRDILVLSRTSDSCGGPGAVHADQVARCIVLPPTHWCGWHPGWMDAVLRSSAAWLGCFGGRMALDLCLSRACTGVVAMRQDSNY
jgi:hypothetical protein